MAVELRESVPRMDERPALSGRLATKANEKWNKAIEFAG
jgi:hypothetical protein